MSPYAEVDFFPVVEPRDDDALSVADEMLAIANAAVVRTINECSALRAELSVYKRTAEALAEMSGRALEEANNRLTGLLMERDYLRAELDALKAELRRLGGAA